MIEPRRFRELCQTNSVYYPFRKKVIYQGIEYYPIRCVEWWTGEGKLQLSSEMYDCKSGIQIRALLTDLEELKE